MTIGYVGLGNMGGPLARRLQLQHKLSVFDLSKDAVQRMVDAGAVACASLSELAAKCDVIFLCLPTSDHVRSAIFGENGLSTGLKPGTLIVDQTTGDPTATRKIAAELADKGIDLIDAPVSGGAAGANTGTIAIMVGAGPEQFARAKPILATISPNVFHAGGIGNGHAIKLVNNMLSGAQRLLTFEAVALAQKSGIDPAVAVEILSAGGARNAFLQKSMLPVLKGDLFCGFTLALMHKDMRLACDLGKDMEVPLLFGNTARDFYQICINQKGRNSDVLTGALVMDSIAGSHVVPENPGAK